MSCLINSVGIRRCGEVSDYYVDDISGIGMNLVAQLKPDDKQAFTSYFSQIKQAAYTQFLTEVELKFSGEKSFNHIISESPSFTTDKSHYLNSTADVLEGFLVEIPAHEFVEYHLKNIDLVCHQAGTILLKVVDLITNQVVHSQTIALVKGKNKVPVNCVHTDVEKELFVSIQIVDAVLSSVLCGAASCSDCDCTESCTGYYTLPVGSAYTTNNLELKSTKFFCVDSQVRCNFETMVCNYPSFFVNSFNHYFGIRILDDKINTYTRGWYSDANNNTVKEETLPMLRKKFDKLLDLAMTNLYQLTNDSVCWSCSSRVQTKPSMHSLV